MRRILAITLLIAFGSPLVLPLLAESSTSQSSLPACCRRNGMHHCTRLLSGNPSAPSLQAPPCPFCPAPGTPLRLLIAAVAAPPAAALPLLRTASPAPTILPSAHLSLPSANLKRGPPAPSLS